MVELESVKFFFKYLNFNSGEIGMDLIIIELGISVGNFFLD